MTRARLTTSDRGAYAILYALLVVVVVLTAAVVVDLSMMREDRRAERLASDSAATAGALKLNALAGTANANAACIEAWNFLRLNLAGASGASANCPTGSFPVSFTTCPAEARTASAPAGPWQVTITWPVPDGHTLMTHPNVNGLGSYTQPIDISVDGSDPCGRLGVTISRDRTFAFAGVGGFTGSSTLNSSVARAEVRGNIHLEMPLVVLDQTGCQALYATGAGTLIEVSNRGITPGRIAMDSNGTEPGNPYPGCANSNQYVGMRNGQGATIRALNGDSGALGMLFTVAPPSKAASAADLCAEGTDPATISGGICPRPSTFIRVTRKYWDWQYHCTKTNIPALSEPCPHSRPDYIQALRSEYNKTAFTALTASSRGWSVVSGGACTVTSPVTYTGNTYVDCSTFQVRATTVFQSGDVVFKGDVAVEGGASANGCLRFNYRTPATGEGPCVIPAAQSGASVNGDMRVYLQDGSLSRQNLDLVAPRTFMFQEADKTYPYSADPNVQMDFGAGSSGAILITAPESGDFEDLAIWSENCGGRTSAGAACDGQAKPGSINGFQASTSLVLEGIFFFPNGRVRLTGQPEYFAAARSQFVAWSLEVAGGAQLRLLPDPDRTLTIPVGGVRLIR